MPSDGGGLRDFAPDVAQTTACMNRNVSKLSPPCSAQFNKPGGKARSKIESGEMRRGPLARDVSDAVESPALFVKRPTPGARTDTDHAGEHSG